LHCSDFFLAQRAARALEFGDALDVAQVAAANQAARPLDRQALAAKAQAQLLLQFFLGRHCAAKEEKEERQKNKKASLSLAHCPLQKAEELSVRTLWARKGKKLTLSPELVCSSQKTKGCVARACNFFFLQKKRSKPSLH
jgi:hypothetical protein